MSVTFVTAFIDLNEDRSNDKSVDTCFNHFQTLLKSGIPIIAFLSKKFENRVQQAANLHTVYIDFEDLDMYKRLNEIQCDLPQNRTTYHDTKNFLILMNSKIEFVKRALDIDPFKTEHFAWIDFSICHVFHNINNSLNYLKMLANCRLKPCLLFPGCWPKGTGIQSAYNAVNWRFCGGFFIGDKQAMLNFYNTYMENMPKIMEGRKTLVWEVNMWAILEHDYGWSPTWFDARHNDSIIRIPARFISVVASLTTIPSRIDSSCKAAIDSLLNQVDHVYLSVANVYKRFSAEIQIPKYLEEESYRSQVTVVKGDDKGPATKYLGALHVIPKNTWTFFCDDDQEYKDNLIERMLQKVDSLQVYQNRCEAIKNTTSGGLIHGYVGNLVNIQQLKNLNDFPLPECSFHVDDQWISAYYFLNNVNVSPTGIESYAEIYKIMENNHEKIGRDSLASLGTRATRVQQLADYFGIVFLEKGKIEKKKDPLEILYTYIMHNLPHEILTVPIV